MKTESEIRDAIQNVDDIIKFVKVAGMKPLVKMANLETFREILLWVLDNSQDSTGTEAEQ